MAKRVVLADSGGLDTSVAVRWMIEEMNVEGIHADSEGFVKLCGLGAQTWAARQSTR